MITKENKEKAIVSVPSRGLGGSNGRCMLMLNYDRIVSVPSRGLGGSNKFRSLRRADMVGFRSLSRIWGVLTGTSTIVSHKLVCFRSLARFRGDLTQLSLRCERLELGFRSLARIGGANANLLFVANKIAFPSPREVGGRV